MKLTLLLTTALLLGLSGALHILTQPFDGPYIYYHDPADGIVIERIDGRHRRAIVGPEMIGRNAWFLGWSPSGEWLAWTTLIHLDRFNDRLHLWMSRADGSDHILVDSNAVTGTWSGASDRLLVWDVDGCSVVDPETQSRQILLRYRPGCPQWTPDGHFLYVRADGHIDSAYRLVFWPQDGPPMARYLDRAPYEWLADGRLAYWQAGQLVLEDLTAGTRDTYPIPPPALNQRVDWSPDGRHALVYTPAQTAADITAMWLLSLEDQTLTPVGGEQAAFYLSYWAPNSSTVFLAGGEWNAYQLDLETRRIVNLGINAPLPTDVAYNPPEVQWLADGKTGYLQVIAEVYRYREGEAALRPDVRRVYVSPDGEGTVVMSRFASSPWVESGGQRYELTSRDPRSVYSAVWHPHDEWLLIQGSDASSSVTWATDQRGRMVLDVLRRGDYFSYEVQAYWLPERVAR